MNKSETRECAKLDMLARMVPRQIGIDTLARSYSALTRSAMTQKSKNEIITVAAAIPAVVQHPDFII